MIDDGRRKIMSEVSVSVEKLDKMLRMNLLHK